MAAAPIAATPVEKPVVEQQQNPVENKGKKYFTDYLTVENPVNFDNLPPEASKVYHFVINIFKGIICIPGWILLGLLDITCGIGHKVYSLLGDDNDEDSSTSIPSSATKTADSKEAREKAKATDSKVLIYFPPNFRTAFF